MSSKEYKCVRHYNFDETDKLSEYKVEGSVSMDKHKLIWLLAQYSYIACKKNNPNFKETLLQHEQRMGFAYDLESPGSILEQTKYYINCIIKGYKLDTKESEV